jgi:zinc transport system substrate-binding protein
MLMVDEITRVLSEVAPEHADQYAENAASFKEELTSIDERIRDRLKSVENKTFIMYHPSLGYFADDYGLEMLAIEAGGKEATVNHLKTVIDFALAHDIRVIFYQDEITSKQAETLAESIDGETVAVSPLSGDYLANLEKIAATLEEHLR